MYQIGGDETYDGCCVYATTFCGCILLTGMNDGEFDDREDMDDTVEISEKTDAQSESELADECDN
jgi:hypothetical protein